MRYILIFCFLIVINSSAAQNNAILQELENTIEKRDIFIKEKYKRIELIKKDLDRYQYRGDNKNTYNSYLSLFKEYKSFQYDSAYNFLEKAKSLSTKLNDPIKLSQTKIKEGFVLLSSGLFKEAIDTLNSVDPKQLSDKFKYEYYAVKSRTFYDLADYVGDSRFSSNYIEKGIFFLNKALEYVEPKSSNYWNTESLKRLKSNNWKSAEEAFNYWIDNYELSPEEYAIASSSLAYVYAVQNKEEKHIKYLALAAIADIKGGIKETVALRNLASELFKQGDLKKANRFISLAMEDAAFYNARHRKVEISAILPIIEKAQIQKTEKQKRTLQQIVIALSILALLVVISLIIIFKQLRLRNASKRILADSNKKLQELNSNLKEADTIKQEYITYFLKVSSGFINRIDNLQKNILQKIIANKPEEVMLILKKYSVKKARQQLFAQFDEVFLKLFPTFKEDYYKLFPESEKVLPNNDSSLNNELRIFALYRLGVQDSNQVADFLELSVATIYSYKTRIKNRSNYKDTFEEKIMDIKQFESKKNTLFN
ncbi:DUF6377 domain-containing protein [uncultured Winogradskyella sp.]|uniref:DUF6377 domain-containing protein n=1 Tax=uncultured Winogradskyella sp. TaxID=395353 RepID=UPI00262D626E|nr:DUF6377 domain-containing protein [uncultured Winogradskyella sp.]